MLPGVKQCFTVDPHMNGEHVGRMGTNWKLKDSRRFDLVVFKYTLFEACIWNGEQNCIFVQPKKQILDAHDLSVRWSGDLGISNLYLVNQKVLLASSRWYPCGGIWVNYTRKGIYGRESPKIALFHEIGSWWNVTVNLVHLDELLQIVSWQTQNRTPNRKPTTHQTRPDFFLRWNIQPPFLR